ncbi:MAG: SRPBCC family protein [Gammaproteobacteria bacterium]|nr:SRPBCC family protein [Gammaproteobacteria bacterium]
MRILRTILFALLALLILLVLGGLLLPSSARVQRSVRIQAPPAAVFEVVNSFKRFNEWSPWYELDPGARYLYSGPEQGVGARFEWSSSKPEVGEGSQQIIESRPYEHVRTRLDFGPQGTAEGQISIVPFEQGSEVTWSFEAQFGYNLLQRYFGLMYDRWIGADFERGLARLKALLETGSADAPSASQMQIEVAEVSAADVVAVEGVSSLEPAAVHAALEEAFARVRSS